MSAKTYLLRTLLFSLLVASIVASINLSVDPYGIVGTPRISGLNKFKVDINEHSRLMKKYQPQFEMHNALIVGNSRVELGIRPSHPCFLRNGMSVYNLGIPGADVRTQLTYALNLVYQQPIQTVFLSVDFTDFISPELQRRAVDSPKLERSKGELKYTPAGAANPEYALRAFQDYLKALFSLDALITSVRTIALQSRVAADRDIAGFNPARDFEEAVRVEGPRALFEQKMFELRSKYSRAWHLRDSHGQLDSAFDDLDAFLTIAAERGIKVYLFTNPFHDKFWDLLRTQGHMPAFQDWMQSMGMLVKKHGSGSVVFWDFSLDTPYVHEPMPDMGARSGPLQWFWEPAHYRRELGDLMVNAMLSDSCDTEAAFGRQVF